MPVSEAEGDGEFGDEEGNEGQCFHPFVSSKAQPATIAHAHIAVDV